jgi:toxin ParE1/3/4
VIPVVITEDAEADLEEIADYFAADNPARAHSYVEELRQKALRIGQSPRGYPPRAHLGRGIRMAVHGRYLILFRVASDTATVLRIVHGARDLTNLF